MFPINPVDEWFNPIYEEHHGKLVRLARGVLGDAELAKDIVNTAFLTLLTKYSELENHPKIDGWLMETVRNLIMNETNRARHSREVPFPQNPAFPAREQPPSLLSVLPSGLKEDERKILCLFFESGFSHEEISATLGCSPDACRMRLYRAKNHYRELIELEKS